MEILFQLIAEFGESAFFGLGERAETLDGNFIEQRV
jgi:hypothetical protein